MSCFDSNRADLLLPQIAAIASRSTERAKDFAKKHDIPKAYGSYEDLARDSDIGELETGIILVALSDITLFCCYCEML